MTRIAQNLRETILNVPSILKCNALVDRRQHRSVSPFHARVHDGPYNSAFKFVRFHCDLRPASSTLYRKNHLRFHAVVEIHARVRSSRALTSQSHDEGNLFTHHYAFDRSERGSDPGISHYFLATAGINHLSLHPVALCNFSFCPQLCSPPSCIARKNVPLWNRTFKNLLSDCKYRINARTWNLSKKFLDNKLYNII